MCCPTPCARRRSPPGWARACTRCSTPCVGRAAKPGGHCARARTARPGELGPRRQCRRPGARTARHLHRAAGRGAQCECRRWAGWRLWPLCDRPPVRSADEMAQGLVGLLGDAAHPMRPYLAQGAGMAIEDAAELQRALAMHDLDVPLRLRRYALNRWQRNARVQARSTRNGRIFHATGPVRWGATCRCACWASACWMCPGCTGATAPAPVRCDGWPAGAHCG